MLAVVAEPPITLQPKLTEFSKGGGMKGYLSTTDLAAALGVSPGTVSAWRSRSRAGGLYAENPFPAPDETYANSPVWAASRLDEIKAWVAARPGAGAGGGRPRKPPHSV